MTRRFGALVIAAALLICSAPAPASAAPDAGITLTFIRHAESTGNTSGVIDTSVPGPDLTDLGWTQARQAADAFRQFGYDGIYASTMVRTQETAYPLSDALGESVLVLPGLREIDAGDYNGQPESSSGPPLYQVMQQWVAGDRNGRIPGSIDGNQFDARFDNAVEAIYNRGDQRPVAFSHGGAIAVWTLMNVKNPRPDLLTTAPLPNTGFVVIHGNPVDGWTLVDWNGIRP